MIAGKLWGRICVGYKGGETRFPTLYPYFTQFDVKSDSVSGGKKEQEAVDANCLMLH